MQRFTVGDRQPYWQSCFVRCALSVLLSLTFAGALAAWEKAVHMLPYCNTLSGRRQSLPNPQVLWTHLDQLSYIAYPSRQPCYSGNVFNHRNCQSGACRHILSVTQSDCQSIATHKVFSKRFGHWFMDHYLNI